MLEKSYIIVKKDHAIFENFESLKIVVKLFKTEPNLYKKVTKLNIK
ncbi:hypothetical protein LCGC14_1176660 [marine sediment metagenome]|uniref:Uncharacterized protein n=1 Tax=marine sediment metagenome TaxID=412755 RepID=A0A0F9PTP7_9ZZZZ